jgi:YgiT-type zinc finger domain-containing protein
LEDQEGNMNCPVCKGEVKRGTINFPVELEGGFLIVKNVPANICGQCGEEFIPDDVAKVLEKIVASARGSKAEIEVVSYEKVA